MTLRGAANSELSPIHAAVQEIRDWLDRLPRRVTASVVDQQARALAQRHGLPGVASLGRDTVILALVYVAQQERAERKRLERLLAHELGKGPR